MGALFNSFWGSNSFPPHVRCAYILSPSVSLSVSLTVSLYTSCCCSYTPCCSFLSTTSSSSLMPVRVFLQVYFFVVLSFCMHNCPHCCWCPSLLLVYLTVVGVLLLLLSTYSCCCSSLSILFFFHCCCYCLYERGVSALLYSCKALHISGLQWV